MRRLTSLVALVLLLSGAVPALACVTGGALSHAESACCRTMHGQCGEMAKTGCCQVDVKSDVQPQLASAAVSVVAPPVTLNRVVVAEAFGQPAAVVVSKVPDEHSPPGLTIVRIANLRI
ncbi:MAG TPA: hypothetical protein VIJ79_11430 [Acidobacteriaceae bacterium]